MEQVTITRESQESRGRYVARVPGFEETAELTFHRTDAGVLVADHTGTPVAMRGRGIASALVGRLVADARSEGFKILPRCPFVVDAFDRHPEWADLRAPQ
jgi:predicted GNAT family acetyltransferase